MEKSLFTCFGKVDEVVCDELLEAPVLIRQRFPQVQLQASKESHGVQEVEGEAAGKRQQVAGFVDRSGWRVRHHVAIHWTAEGRWEEEEEVIKIHLNNTTKYN